MTLVLVFAMSGGAYAAKKYIITSLKQISPAVIKELRGKQGPPGQNGAPGANGKDGAPGAKGDTGPEGKPGVEGKEGKPGTEGKEGKPGAEGSPWVVGGLPTGASENGEWAASGTGELIETAIAFSVPLLSSLPESNVHFIGEEEGEGEKKPAPAITNKECEGTYKAPKAASKHLCVFVHVALPFLKGFSTISALDASSGADKMGAILAFFPEKPAEVFFANGSWVVTG